VNSLQTHIEFVEKLSKQEIKTLLQRMVKLQEEVGELAQEVLVHEKASGSQYKEAGADGILGECTDIMLVTLSIFYHMGASTDDLAALLEKKSAKWAKHQLKA